MIIRKKLSERMKNELLNHGGQKPSRRDFIGQCSAYSAATLFLSGMPNLKLLAQNSECPPLGNPNNLGNTPVAFLEYHASGGAAMHNCLVGLNAAMQPEGIQYSRHGVPPEWYPGQPGVTLDTSLVHPFHHHSAFMNGFKQRLMALGMLNIMNHMVVINGVGQSRSDSNTNMQSALHCNANVGFTGAITFNIANSVRHRLAQGTENFQASPVTVRSADQGSRIAGAGAIMSRIGNENAAFVRNAIARMSVAHLQKFQQLDTTEQKKLLAECGFSNASQIPDLFDQNALDARSSINNAHMSVFSNRNSREAAITHLVCSGYASAGVVENGGYDNHNGTGFAPWDRRFSSGQKLAEMFASAYLLNKPTVIFYSTDGSMNITGSGDGHPVEDYDPFSRSVLDENGNIINANIGARNRPNDNDTRANQALFILAPGKTQDQILRNVNRTQIGYYGANASVAPGSSLVEDNPTNMAFAFYLNYLALSGNESKLAEAIKNPNHPLVAQMEDYILVQNILS